MPEAKSNVNWLLLCWSAGLILGIASMVRNVLVKPRDDLSVVRRSIALLGRLCVYSGLLAMPLAITAIELDNPVVTDVTTFASTQSWLFGVGRPVCAILVGIPFGVAASVHATIRWLLAFQLLTQVVLDTLSASELHRFIGCLQRDMCTHVSGWNNTGMAFIWLRDVMALVLEVWALVLLGHVFVLHGVSLNVFTHDQLSDTFDSRKVMNDNLEQFALVPPREIQLRAKLRQL